MENIKYWWRGCKVMDWYRGVKWFIQRGKRGYADCDVWNVDWYLAEIIPKMLRELKKENHGCPDEFFDQTKKPNQCVAWEEKLEEIAQGFDDWVESSNWVEGMTYEEYKNKHDRLTANFRKQMAEFTRLYGAFWD